MSVGGRPRNLAAVRPPCPDNHEGTVYLHGERARKDGLYARPRYCCVRPHPTKPGALKRHVFTLPRHAPTHRHPDGRSCPSCEHEATRGEGASIIPAWDFSLADAAHSLHLIGKGVSMRGASQELRFAGGKFEVDHLGRRWASRENSLTSDYLDQFGPVVVRAMTPATWPRILVLDSLPLGMRARGCEKEGYDRFRRGGAVLVAAGRSRGQPRTRCWLAGLAGDESAEAWWEFLGLLDADPPPFWVVADGAKAIRNAVEARWPNAHFYPCEYHLRENATGHARDDGAAEVPGLERAIRRAFYGIEAWEHLGRLINDKVGASFLLGWYVRMDAEARRMIELKHRYGDYPNGNGPAERVTVAIGSRLGERTRVFRNAERLATVIALMGLDLSEQASEARYGRILRDELAKVNWRTNIDWEEPHDLADADYDSVAELIMTAWARQDDAAPEAMRQAVSASVERKAAVVNMMRAGAGVEPLTPTVSPGSVVASVSVKGKLLRDFPEVLAEWDPELNVDVDDPTLIPAGAGIRPHWVCANGHRWRAWLTDRTKRLTKCRRCNRQWADETTSIAAVHPELVAEWDAEGNGARTPDRTKATTRGPVIWRCLAGLGHEPYPMSPLARGNKLSAGKPGCPECRRGLTKRAQGSPRRRTSARQDAGAAGRSVVARGG